MKAAQHYHESAITRAREYWKGLPFKEKEYLKGRYSSLKEHETNSNLPKSMKTYATIQFHVTRCNDIYKDISLYLPKDITVNQLREAVQF